MPQTSTSAASRFDLRHLVNRRRGAGSAATSQSATPVVDEPVLDLVKRRDQLRERVAELQWDLGGLVYEMAIRDRLRVDVIVQHAVALQDADAELGEVERILNLEQNSTAGMCPSCGAPHSSGAGFCWQCGRPILHQVDTASIFQS